MKQEWLATNTPLIGLCSFDRSTVAMSWKTGSTEVGDVGVHGHEAVSDLFQQLEKPLAASNRPNRRQTCAHMTLEMGRKKRRIRWEQHLGTGHEQLFETEMR